MSGKQSDLEGRLDDMLSRIAMETQEIKELEQQLTDGQILVNESLQKDLEDIISGLQQYVRDLRQQAQQQVHSLQLHLEDSQQHCRQLEDAAKTHRQDMSVLQEELSLLRTEAQALRDRQVELEAELTQQVTVRQLECDALQAAVDKEKQSREIRESQLQSTIDTLQDDKSSLQQTVQTLQVQLDQTRTQYKDSRTLLDQTRVQLDQITSAMLDPQEVQSGPEELDQDQFSPEHMLSRSVEQLFRAVRQTATSRDQLQRHRQHSQEQVAGLQAQPEERVTSSRDRDQEQDQDHDREPDLRLKDQDQDQDREQDREPDWRLKEQLERLRLRLQRSQSRNRRVQHKLEAKLEQSALQLQDVEQQRDELRLQRDELQQQRDELQQQRDELRLQRDELQQQRDKLRLQRDELQQQLRSQSDAHHRKLRQLSRSMCDADQLTAEQLTTTTDQLRALNHRVESAVEQIDSSSDRRSEHAHTHAHTHTHTHAVEELQAELEKAQRHTHRLRQKLDRVRTRTRTRTRTRSGEGGQWCFIPPGHSDPSLGSVGTQDSGLGLGLGLHHLSSPERGQPPTGGGYWVYMPPTNADTAEWRDSGGGSDGDRSSRGRSPPPAAPAPAAAASAGLSDAHTPLAAPAWLLCAALHCNVPEHTHKQGDKCVCECVHKESERLKEEKKKLRLETKQLRHTLRQHRSVMQVCDEVECVEKTLLKRRAELRRADRLLLEAQSCTHTTRDKQENLELRRLKTEEILLKQRLNSLFTHTA